MQICTSLSFVVSKRKSQGLVREKALLNQLMIAYVVRTFQGRVYTPGRNGIYRIKELFLFVKTTIVNNVWEQKSREEWEINRSF